MITSTKNSRIVQARKLSQRKHRQRQDRFLVYGLQLLVLARQHPRAKPYELFYCESLFTGHMAQQLLTDFTATGTEAISVSPNVLATLSERDTPQGLVATFAPSEVESSLDELFQMTRLPFSGQASLILVVDQLQDPGNLGTLIRTADAIGATGMALLEPCVDPFDIKTVRGSMGSLFTMPFTRQAHLATLIPYLNDRNYRLVGADGRRGETAWHSEALRGDVVLVLGNEARGLSDALQPYLTDYVSLPLRGQAESLNVAVAGGALMYEWLRINEGF